MMTTNELKTLVEQVKADESTLLEVIFTQTSGAEAMISDRIFKFSNFCDQDFFRVGMTEIMVNQIKSAKIVKKQINPISTLKIPELF